MPGMDVFNNNAFSLTSLSGVVNQTDYRPTLLGDIGIFDPVPVRTLDVFVDRRSQGLRLLPYQPDGAPPQVRENEQRSAVSLRIGQLAERRRVMAREVQGIRAFGSESELMGVQSLFAERLTEARSDMELTFEHHRLGALQGKVLDADGVTVIYDYFQEFNEAEAAPINFELDTATTIVRTKCAEVTRAMARSAKGSFTNSTSVHALAGDEFYDKLIDHVSVRDTYLNFAAAQDLRRDKVFSFFVYGGITWHNYRGTDDGVVGVASNEARFFPVGARDMFKHAMAPHGSTEYVNTPGQATYAMAIPDRDRQLFVDAEVYAYPLFICQQPRVLRSAVAA